MDLLLDIGETTGEENTECVAPHSLHITVYLDGVYWQKKGARGFIILVPKEQTL